MERLYDPEVGFSARVVDMTDGRDYDGWRWDRDFQYRDAEIQMAVIAARHQFFFPQLKYRPGADLVTY